MSDDEKTSQEEGRFYGRGDPLMEAMFGSCVRWAWENPETRRAFEQETGMRSAGSPIEAMVDDATGYDEEVAEAFVHWVIGNVWGGPDSGRAERGGA